MISICDSVSFLFCFVEREFYNYHNFYRSRESFDVTHTANLFFYIVFSCLVLLFLCKARDKSIKITTCIHHIKITTQWYAYKLLLRHLFPHILVAVVEGFISIFPHLRANDLANMRLEFTKQLHQLYKVCHYFNYPKRGGCCSPSTHTTRKNQNTERNRTEWMESSEKKRRKEQQSNVLKPTTISLFHTVFFLSLHSWAHTVRVRSDK